MSEDKLYDGYCVKCRAKREFVGTPTKGPSGRHMAVGKCPVCGSKVNRLLPNPNRRVGGDGPDSVKDLLL